MFYVGQGDLSYSRIYIFYIFFFFKCDWKCNLS